MQLRTSMSRRVASALSLHHCLSASELAFLKGLIRFEGGRGLPRTIYFFHLNGRGEFERFEDRSGMRLMFHVDER